VFFLGVVSFLTDVSSEMMFTILPLFLFNVLCVGMPVIGLIEGIAASTNTLVQIGSGWLSDRLGRRKALAVLGYGLSTAAKPFLYFVSAWTPVLAVRFADRMGKGIRTAPRDALLAASTSPEERGKGFGFHRALDTLGAVVGVGVVAVVVYLMQSGTLELTEATFRTIVLVGIVPAVLSLIVLLLFVRDIKVPAKESSARPSLKLAFSGFDRQFKAFLGVMVLFTLGNFGIVFMILRAQNLGNPVFSIMLMLILFNIVYAISSMPAGMLSDRLGRRRVIALGWGICALSYLGFALASAWWQVWILFTLFGLYHGTTDGVLRAFVADMVAVERRGTAYGLFQGAIGIAALPACLIAGFLWQGVNPAAPFLLGAVVVGISAIALFALVRER
jgi:MFS family permease